MVVLVDFSGFNRRFAAALRRRAEESAGCWQPKLVYYVSPQVWASRPGRAKSLERDRRICCWPSFPLKRLEYAIARSEAQGWNLLRAPPSFRATAASTLGRIQARPVPTGRPAILLLPGSRQGELKRHLPVMLEAAREIERKHPAHWTMILPDERLLAMAGEQTRDCELKIEMKVGGLAEALISADLAIASTGTVMPMECRLFSRCPLRGLV